MAGLLWLSFYGGAFMSGFLWLGFYVKAFMSVFFVWAFMAGHLRVGF